MGELLRTKPTLLRVTQNGCTTKLELEPATRRRIAMTVQRLPVAFVRFMVVVVTPSPRKTLVLLPKERQTAPPTPRPATLAR